MPIPFIVAGIVVAILGGAATMTVRNAAKRDKSIIDDIIKANDTARAREIQQAQEPISDFRRFHEPINFADQ